MLEATNNYSNKLQVNLEELEDKQIIIIIVLRHLTQITFKETNMEQEKKYQ